MPTSNPALEAAEAHRRKQAQAGMTPVVPVTGKAGEILQHLHPGEPVFVLRAQDVLSVLNMNHYLTLIETYSPHSDQAQSITDMIGSFLSWQRANPSLVKLPD